MDTEPRTLVVGDLQVAVVRKAIKNLHLGVYPPDGRVRVAAPLALSDEAIRLAVLGKLGWIRRQRTGFAAQPRESEREMVSGESHMVFGERRLLTVLPAEGRARVELQGQHGLVLHAPGDSTDAVRREALNRWYRARLRAHAAPLFERWQAALGVESATWGIKRMKTMWGACNPDARRIWLNLELAKKPPECIEYIVVHELAHLLSRHHDAQFAALLDRHLPAWRSLRERLNAEPLGHERWTE
jgi:predicted metal-dependent hydrolase